MGGRQLEGEVVGLAHLHCLLEQAAPGVDRAAVSQRRSGECQDVGAGRRILAPLAVLERLLDVSVHLLARRQPREHPGEGSLAQPDRERTAHTSASCGVDRLARRPIGPGRLPTGKGQGRRGDQRPYSLVIGCARRIGRGVQPPVHFPGQAAVEPEADDRLGEVHQRL